MFDPYHKWLGIPKKYRPPTLYQILGIEEDEDDDEVIDEAAIRQSAHIRTYQTGPQGDLCTKLLNEISKARTVLLNPAKRKQYDAELQRRRPKKSEPPAVDKDSEANAVFADLGESPSLVSLHGSSSGTNLGGKKPKRRTGVDLEKPEADAKKKKLMIIGIAGGAVVLLLAILIPVLMFAGGSADDSPEEFVEKRGKKQPVIPNPIDPKPNPIDPKPIPNPNPIDPKPIPNPIDPIPVSRIPVKFVAANIAPDLKQPVEVGRLRANPNNRLYTFFMLPDEQKVVLSGDKSIQSFDLDSKKSTGLYSSYNLMGSPIYNYLDEVENGKQFYSVHVGEPFVRLWDTETRNEIARFHPVGSKFIRSFALSPDGSRAVLSDEAHFRIWDAKNKRELYCSEKMYPYPAFVFHGDGQTLVAGGRFVIDVWNIEQQKKRKAIAIPNCQFIRAAKSKTGAIALTYHGPNRNYGTIVLSPDLGDAVDLKADGTPTGVSFSNDGKYLVVAARGNVRVYATADYTLLSHFTAHSGSIFCARFSSDAKKLFTCGDDGFFKIWDLTGKAVVAVKRSDLPTPKLGLIGKRDATSNGVKIGTSLELRFENWAEYKDDLFTPVELDLPMRGKRTERPLELKLFDESGHLIFRYSGFPSHFLQRIVRTFRDDQPMPKGLYAVLEDRRTNTTAKSNILMLDATSPTPLGTIPTPKLALLGSNDAISNGVKVGVTYEFRFENAADYDKGLFVPFEFVSSSGTKSTRRPLDVSIYTDAGDFRGVSPGIPDRYMQRFRVTVRSEQPKPSGFFVKLFDRRTSKTYKSNIVPIPGGKLIPEPVAQREPLPIFPFRKFDGSGVRKLVLRPKQTLHLTVGRNVQLWNSTTGKFIELSKSLSGADREALAVSPKGKIGATSVMGELDVNIWSLSTFKIMRVCQGHTEAVRTVAFLPDGKQLLSASEDKTVRLWNVLNGQEMFRFQGHTNPIYSLAVSSDGKWFVSLDRGGELRKWDLEKRSNLNTTRLFSSTAGAAVDLSPDDKHIAVGCSSNLTILDSEKFTPVRRAVISQGAGQSVRYSPDGKLLATCGNDDFACVWDAATLEELFRIQHGYRSTDAQFAPDGLTVFICTYRGISVAKLPKSRDDFVVKRQTVYSREGALSTTLKDDLHTLKLAGGRTYIIDMKGLFDTYLTLESAQGARLATDDDGGEGLNSRLIFTPPQTAIYRVIASSLGKRYVGRYDLQVQELTIATAKKNTK